MNDFKIIRTLGNARAGVLTTAHGRILTPMFMPVGTKASVKALSWEDIDDCGAQIVLANTYHLFLRPGDRFIMENFGGLHQFTGIRKPILTDSGGFQVLSLSKVKNSQLGFNEDGVGVLTEISEQGVRFRSYLDGSYHFIDPESSVNIQMNLGSDIIMAFDEADPSTTRAYAKDAMRRSMRWLARSVVAWKRRRQLTQSDAQLFGIIQGGQYKDLRKESAEFVNSQDLPGMAVGGTSIGSNAAETSQIIGWVKEIVSSSKPLYAMGVGVKPSDIVAVILDGADLFDCVAPTRLARTGYLYSGTLRRIENKFKFESEFEKERINISQARFKKDTEVIQIGCDCLTCRSGYTRAYLHYLFKARELLYYRLASMHNVRFMINICTFMREQIMKHD